MITPDRQQHLNQLLAKSHGYTDAPLRGETLSRAEVEWMLDQHKPIDWDQEDQRWRLGLNLRGAILRHVNLSGLPLARTQFGYGIGSLFGLEDIELRTLAAANLEGANLQGTHLDGADLQGVNLRQARLSGAYLRKANCAEAMLQEARLMHAHLEGAQFPQAHLEGAKLAGVHLEGANLWGAYLMAADLSCMHLENDQGQIRPRFDQQDVVHLEGCTLINAHLEDASLIGARLDGAVLAYAQLQRAILLEAHLHGARLFNAYLQGTDLTRVHLEGANTTEDQRQRVRAWSESFPNQLPPADLRRAVFDTDTVLEGLILGDGEHGSALVADAGWAGVNLAGVDWARLDKLGDELAADEIAAGQDNATRLPAGFDAQNKETPVTPLEAYERAVRANRQLALALRSQGLSRTADRFDYRAQVLLGKVLQRRQRWLERRVYYAAWCILGLLVGYGYKLWRILLCYLALNGVYALLYWRAAAGKLSAWDAFLVSMVSLHGRGFLSADYSMNIGNPPIIIPATEAAIGLLVEAVLIAVLVQRLFRR